MSHSSEGNQDSTIYVGGRQPLVLSEGVGEKPLEQKTVNQALKDALAAAKLTTDRNVVFCDVQIASLTGRIATAEFSGEDKADLQKRLDGYLAKKAELIKDGYSTKQEKALEAAEAQTEVAAQPAKQNTPNYEEDKT